MKSLNLLFIALISLSFLSCSKELEDGATYGTTDYILTINGTDLSQNKASLSKNQTDDSNEQTIITQLDENTNVVATLIPLNNNTEDQTITKKAATEANRETVTQELAENTKIKILVYDLRGDKVEEIEHVYKKNGQNIIVENLTIGEEYTFIAYSTNSTQTIPSATNSATLSNLKIPGLNSDFLYFKQKIQIQKNTKNPLSIKLKHQFSSVYMSLAIDQTGDLSGSRITQITAPTISPAYTSAEFDLNAGTPTFGTKINEGKALPIANDQLSQETIISNTSLILADGTPSTLNINSLTINGYTQSINLTGFNIQPGVKYHLKLAIACPCTMDVTPTKDISIKPYNGTLGNTNFQSPVEYNNADFGAVLDIYRIDNSLNLSINGTPIYRGSATVTEGSVTNFSYPPNELQFQGYGRWRDVSSPPNLEFEDGTRWGTNIITSSTTNERNEIWKFDGYDTSSPVMRITIDKNGNINMFASKNTKGGAPFYPIKTINNQTVRTNDLNENYQPTNNNGGYISYRIMGSFQKVPWNNAPGQVNTLVFGQRESGSTSFEGRITGKKVVPCTQP